MSYKLNIDLNQGLNFRSRSAYADVYAYFQQFRSVANTKLQKQIFLQIPTGLYLVTDHGEFHLEIGPENERAAQWELIPKACRQKECGLYRNKAHYDAMAVALRILTDECDRKPIVPYDPFDL